MTDGGSLLAQGAYDVSRDDDEVSRGRDEVKVDGLGRSAMPSINLLTCSSRSDLRSDGYFEGDHTLSSRMKTTPAMLAISWN